VTLTYDLSNSKPITVVTRVTGFLPANFQLTSIETYVGSGTGQADGQMDRQTMTTNA